VLGRDLDVLVRAATITVLVLDADIRKVHVAIEVGEVVLARPGPDLTNVVIRAAVAVSSATVAPLAETLILPFELVVEGDAADAPSLATETRCGLQVSPVDLTVVGKLARLPEACVELLTGFSPVLVILLETVGFKEVSAAARQEDDAFAGTAQGGMCKALTFKVREALPRVVGAVPPALEIAL